MDYLGMKRHGGIYGKYGRTSTVKIRVIAARKTGNGRQGLKGYSCFPNKNRQEMGNDYTG